MTDEKQALRIRPAAESDTALVLTFIRKLAEYGDISDEVRATEDDIARPCSARGPWPRHPGLRWKRAVGFALYSFTFASFLGRPGHVH